MCVGSSFFFTGEVPVRVVSVLFVYQSVFWLVFFCCLGSLFSFVEG